MSSLRPDQMTAAELELVVALEFGEGAGASSAALEELGRRARAVELLEDHFPSLNRARNRTKDPTVRRALNACSELVMVASPSRRRILRDLGAEEVASSR